MRNAHDELIETVDLALQKRGMTLAQVAVKDGLIENTLYRLKDSEPKINRVAAICDAIGLEFYIGPPRYGPIPEPSEVVPHYGEIGAGGGDMPTDGRVYHATGETTDTTGAPIDIKPQHLTRWGGLVALTVRGRSMEPLFRDGDTLHIYGDDPTAADPNRLIGKDCAVVVAEEGETYIKRIRRADNGEAGYFNLESLNPAWPTMTDVQLLQANPVRYIRRAI